MSVIVSDEAVAAYQPHIESLAWRHVGFANAEFDDLVQEGRIAVWQALSRGLRPATTVIEGRMKDWVRYLRRLQHNDAVAYELLLPIEEYDSTLWQV
jgi:DNA-directed RNA polymerase specialized sigma24 family protein